jgi:plastocyanin
VLTGASDVFSAGSPADSKWANPDGSMRPFDVVIDAPTGEYQYRCLIHDGMTGTVGVVDDAAPLDNPTAAEIAAEIAADTANADALYAAKSQQRPPTIEGGQRVWTVDVGARTADRHVDLLAYFPGTPVIAPGDAVRYVSVEPHTVTFPAAAVGPTLGPAPVPFGTGAAAFLPTCDPDDPAGGVPGAVLMPVATPCPAGSSFELAMPVWMTAGQHAPGDVVATPTTIHNSGLLVPSTAPEFQRGLPKGSGRHFPAEFRALFPVVGDYALGCSLHAAVAMRGGVTVR